MNAHNIPVSGGFATVHPNNKLTINVVEAAPLDAFSPEVSSRRRLNWSNNLTIFPGCTIKSAGSVEGRGRKRVRGRQARSSH